MEADMSASEWSGWRRAMIGALAFVFSSWQPSIYAQAFPTKPITLVSPFAAGGTSDVVARATARLLERELGQAVVVVNRPGAGGTLGIASVATASADGYTLVMGGLGSIVFPTVMYKGRIKYDAARDLTLIGSVASAPTVIAARATLPAKSFAELIASAKKQPNKLSFGSAGIGGTLHVAGVLLERDAGIELNHIPYKGGAPAMTDLAGGTLDIALADMTLVKPLIGSERIRPLAVASSERSPLLPDVPTTTELGFPGVQLDTWYAVFAPTGTSATVLARLRAALEKSRSAPEFVTVLTSQGLVPLAKPFAVFDEHVKRDFVTWPALLTQICAKSSCD
jgi:tripartite-type tricarboxylate transporter receptor subunit TctC